MSNKRRVAAVLVLSAAVVLAARTFASDARAVKLESPRVATAGFDGTWESDEPTRRFRLKIAGGTVEWTERFAGTPDFVRKVPLQIERGGQARISRPNDEACLTFLGFQPALRAAIIAHSPKPSFMMLSQEGSDLIGMWNGLLAIKDAKGKFQSLKQPGENPAKRFVFKPSK
jgi:hypothetical protein